VVDRVCVNTEECEVYVKIVVDRVCVSTEGSSNYDVSALEHIGASAERRLRCVVRAHGRPRFQQFQKTGSLQQLVESLRMISASDSVTVNPSTPVPLSPLSPVQVHTANSLSR